MKRSVFMAVAILLGLILSVAGQAEAAGLLGKNHAAFRAGIADFGDFDESGSFGELRAQVALKGPRPVDLIVSHLVGGTDNYDVWITRLGANVQVQQRGDMRIYAGGTYTFFEWENWWGASDDDTFVGVHAGVEKDISPNAAIDARFVLEDIGDEMDPQLWFEVINNFDSQFSGLLGISTWLDSEVTLYYAGVTISF